MMSACCALGAWTRASGIALLLLYAMFFARNPFAFGGSWAWMFKAFLLYTILATSGRHLSIDAWRRCARSGETGEAAPSGEAAPNCEAAPNWLGPAIPLRLLQMHICTVYAAAAWERLFDPGWQRGEMIFAALTDEWFGRYPVDWFPLVGVLRVLTYSAFALELLAPFLLWSPLRRWCVVALIGMHISLELLSNLGWWQYQMISVLPVFLPTLWLAPIVDRRRRGRPSKRDRRAS